ncbi:hypothetical protein AJ79_06741 [Helicocarpus griseus UAMH5409]|uniref:HNH nuclease domain-containing protein n=1 Tax=Helicocarpus griseus UAMH5409 TaxID=1447875 RepID=A0A2B7X259_9EURO|nr:hypothetical protein AJ79_06741 [Helicocarpus griseus UAMH5409]
MTKLSEVAAGDTPVSPTSSLRSRPDTRSKEAIELCRMRDKNRCVITGAEDPVEVAQIFPFSMKALQSPDTVNDTYNPWSVLRVFWTQERVNTWYNAITGPLATESVQNLMCFAPHVHKYHERAYFALEPVEEDPESHALAVRFQSTPAHRSLVILAAVAGYGCGIVESGEEILSDTLIRITAHDEIPLPDPALLQLQRILHRIIALAGGAEAVDEPYDDDDYHDEPYPEFNDEDDTNLDLRPPATSSSHGQFGVKTQRFVPWLAHPVR